MNNYLASGLLKEASTFVVNFNFEFLQGCKFHCPGCYVNKTQEKVFKNTDYLNLKKLLIDLKDNQYQPFIAFIGPVDFLTADNSIKVLSDKNVIDILSHFKRVSFQTTYMNLKQAQEISHTLNKHYFNNEIEINLIVEPSKITDTKYLDRIEKNKNTFLSLLKQKEVRSFGIMNVYDYDKTSISNLLKDYEFMHKKVEHLFETTIDYNFSLGRNPNLSSLDFKSAVNRIKDLFNKSVISKEHAQYLRFSFGKLTDSLIERQFNYLNGKIFYSPLLYERFVSFSPNFQIPVQDFTVKELEKFENNLINQQYSYAPSTDECTDCMFLGSCVDRGILFLMQNYNSPECLVAKKALETINNSGHPG